MVQSVMNLGYSREEPVRTYTNVSASERGDTSKLTGYNLWNSSDYTYSAEHLPRRSGP